jgi:polyisoprenoid-binding protein YceI
MNKLAILFLSASAFAAPVSLSVDTESSVLKWTGKKVTGEHFGTVKVASGKVNLVDGTLKGGTFDIDMTSISVIDIKDPKYNKKLTDHLLSEDFFNALEFPKAQFEIKEAKRIEGAKDGEPNYEITGTLSIKGIENDVTFPALVKVNGSEASAKATVTLDRTKWNVKYGSGKFFENLGDKLIYDDFTVELDVKAKA